LTEKAAAILATIWMTEAISIVVRRPNLEFSDKKTIK
jgi:hypothetical protein